MKTSNPMTWLESLASDASSGAKRLAVLVDPEDAPSGKAWLELLGRLRESEATDVFVGGSLVTHNSTQRVVQELKRAIPQPVVLFPGATTQVVGEADALLFLNQWVTPMLTHVVEGFYTAILLANHEDFLWAHFLHLPIARVGQLGFTP